MRVLNYWFFIFIWYCTALHGSTPKSRWLYNPVTLWCLYIFTKRSFNDAFVIHWIAKHSIRNSDTKENRFRKNQYLTKFAGEAIRTYTQRFDIIIKLALTPIETHSIWIWVAGCPIRFSLASVGSSMYRFSCSDHFFKIIMQVQCLKWFEMRRMKFQELFKYFSTIKHNLVRAHIKIK